MISKDKAFEIARRQFVPGPEAFRIYSDLPKMFKNVYRLPDEPCWFIIAPWNNGMDGGVLLSSHLIIISKQRGKVLYDGPAGDEG